jgi:hypothetical protein
VAAVAGQPRSGPHPGATARRSGRHAEPSCRHQPARCAVMPAKSGHSASAVCPFQDIKYSLTVSGSCPTRTGEGGWPNLGAWTVVPLPLPILFDRFNPIRWRALVVDPGLAVDRVHRQAFLSKVTPRRVRVAECGLMPRIRAAPCSPGGFFMIPET